MVVGCSASFASPDAGADLGAPDAARDVDAGTSPDARPDLGAPDVDAGTGPDAGDGLTDAERAYLAASLRAGCVGAFCEPDDWPGLHGDVDVCMRILGPLETPLADALASGVLTFDPTNADACLAAMSACPASPRLFLDPPCSTVLTRAHPRATGDPCAVDAECPVGEICSVYAEIGAVCPERRCIVPTPIGGACYPDYACGDATAPVVCDDAGHCARERLVTAVDGDPCGRTGVDPDGSVVVASCPPSDACFTDTSPSRCAPRRTEGAPCESHWCAPPLICSEGTRTCIRPTYLGLGAHGCTAGELAGVYCDVTLGLTCDGASNTCVTAGDGSDGSVCSTLGYPFLCARPLACIAGRCAAPLPLGAACGTVGVSPTYGCADLCGPDGTCVACGAPSTPPTAATRR